MNECCGNCKFWDLEGGLSEVDGQEQGQCRRYPPTYHDDCVGCFPETYDINWCGEWQPTKEYVAANPPPSLDMGIQKVAGL